MSKCPDFIIVGGMKCGTTVLWHNLNNHPDITMINNPEDPKKTSTEIRFWNDGKPHRTWRKGMEWYTSLFPDGVCGEKCANYIEDKNVFQRLSIHSPDTKIIMCIREPSDRAYSEYQMQLHTQKGKHKNGFEKAMHNKGYLKRGQYYNMINNNVLPYFDKDKIHICIQEKMMNNTNDEINKIYEFLSLPKHEIDIAEINSADKDKKIDIYKKWSTKYSKMSDVSRKTLKKYYKNHNENLFDFIGYRIEEWE